MARIGLIAGQGNLPIIFSISAKKRGDTIIAFGLKGVTCESLAGHVDKMHWLEWGNLKMGLLLLATERIRKIVMLGKLDKGIFFKGDEALDEKAKGMLGRLKDRKDSALFNEIAKVFSSMGIEVLDSTTYLKDFVPQSGTLTKRQPSRDEWDDINYGRDVAKELAKFDIGQTIIVKDKTVIALEAVEGTDAAIRRAGSLSPVGFTVVKVARPAQDMRFDVPLIGLQTLKALADSGGRVLALEQGKTLLMDRDEIIKLADEKDISIVVI